MALTRVLVENIFAPLATKDFGSFFTHVSPNVDWIVPPGDGHILNPVAGHYHSPMDFAKATSPLGKCMQSGGIALHVVAVTIDSEQRRAAVELSANEIQKNGKPFKNAYTWVCQFNDDCTQIIAVRAYLDTHLIVETLQNNKECWECQ